MLIRRLRLNSAPTLSENNYACQWNTQALTMCSCKGDTN